MKTFRKHFGELLIVGGVIVASLVGAQVAITPAQSGTGGQAPDSVVQIAADESGLSPLDPASVANLGTGTYWVAYAGQAPVPMPFLPVQSDSASTPIVYSFGFNSIYLVDLTGGVMPQPTARQTMANINTASLVQGQLSGVLGVIDLVQQAQAALNAASGGGMGAMGMDDPSPGGGGGGDNGGQNTNSFQTDTFDHSQLWIQISNVCGGVTFLSLQNGTNQVYAIWGTTNLATPFASWQVETELWPTAAQSNVLAFTVPTLRQPILFLRAEDWTGVDTDGDGVPDWWAWLYWGTNNLPDTNLDYSGNGNTFAQDYSNNIPPTVFNFNGIIVTNNYVSSCSVAAQLDAVGYPYYIATLVDDTNFDDAIWNAYTSTNVILNLGSAEGWHEVWIGLRGHADTPSVAAWQWCRLKLDYTPPTLVVTGPTNGTVDTPMIQLTGYSLEDLGAISFDIANCAGLLTNQQISVTDRFFDTNTWELTTNTFQGYDIFLTNGVNTVTIRATDLAGNVTILVTNITLDYSGKTNPPIVQLTWPTDGTLVTGNTFTLDGQLLDPTVTVTASITDINENTTVVAGLVGRTGQFCVQNIPLSAGTNALTLTVVDAVGNTTVTNINLVQSPLVLTLNPISDTQQLWQPTINLTGSISDATYAVWVNSVKGHNNGDGTWSANNVPVDSGGMASFTITGYSPDEAQPDGSRGNQN